MLRLRCRARRQIILVVGQEFKDCIQDTSTYLAARHIVEVVGCRGSREYTLSGSALFSSDLAAGNLVLDLRWREPREP